MATVDEYMESVSADRKVAMGELRKLCRKILKGYEEKICYGVPTYSRNGKPEVAFGSKKQYISFYILKKRVVEDHREQLAGLPVGKGCIRYRKPVDMDFGVIGSMLNATVLSPEEPC